MPFEHVGKNKNRSPSGRMFTNKQVRLYYLTDGFKHMYKATKRAFRRKHKKNS